jgi:bifunctional non-homologous end joining protein LigD
MLATAGDAVDVDDGNDWAFEMKWDGIRALARVEGEDVHLVSRNGNDLTATYPEIVEGLRDGATSRPAVFDGEIVAADRRGRPDFGQLQTRMGLSRKKDVERAARAAPVQYLLFDMLERDGTALTDETYDTRRALLGESVRPAGPILLPPVFDGDLAAAMRSSRDLGLEGVMAKRRSSTYRTGRRSRAWIKIKHHRTQEVVIGGWRGGNGRRANGVGSLLLGVPSPHGLRYVGRVGTGFTDRQLDELATRLASRGRKTTPFIDVPAADASDAHWVRADLVGEVEFSEWTATRRLRQPSWRGWRPDKKPDEVVEESGS